MIWQGHWHDEFPGFTNQDKRTAMCTIWFLDPQNTVLDSKIIILDALVQRLWPKTRFHEKAEMAP